MWVSVLLLGAAGHLVSELPAGAEGDERRLDRPMARKRDLAKAQRRERSFKRFGSECS